METQIAEFGQIPIKIFNNPHPQKKTRTFNLTKNLSR